jgi:hypoxanthine phosphoribosyltransferase
VIELAEPAALFTEAAIRQRVAELAEEISADYRRRGVEEVLLVGVLRGAFIFLADLCRCLTISRRIDFVSLSRYDQGTRPGELRLLLDLRSELRGVHALLVEDILDTGHTLRFLQDRFQARAPASLRTCVLVRKPARTEVEVEVDYLGFEIPDVWVVGYGLDCADSHRALPYIGRLAPTC